MATRRFKVDKAKLAFGIPERIRDRKHLDWIRSLPCCVTGGPPPSDPAHISAGNGKGVACKVGDDNCVPLSWTEHRLQHSKGERSYWGQDLDRAKQLGKDLYEVSGDYLRALILLSKFRFGL